MRNWLFVIICVTIAACGGKKEASPKQINLDLTNNERYVSPDYVAARMIEKDPSLRLIDVRPTASFLQFSLPGAYNIPMEELLQPESQRILDCERYSLVFFSNDDLLAGNAWQLSRRQGCRSSFIMKGGLNEWTRCFLTPPEPPQTASAEALELYQFRRAACQYFIGASDALTPEPFLESAPKPSVRPKQSVKVKAKPKTQEEDEGC